MTAIPPSRYKVVERGRRLVVIDTRTGKPASPEHGRVEPALPQERTAQQRPAPPRTAPPQTASARPIEETGARRIDDRSGAAILVTSRLYDIKAPRSIVMDDRFNDRIGKAIGGWMIALFSGFGFAFIFFPWLMIVPVIALLQPKVRAAIRQWITARLDEVQAAS